MISLLVPSRGRPHLLYKMAQSAVNTAEGEVEIVCYIDEDDPKLEEYKSLGGITLFTTKRTILSKYWNMAYQKAKGPIYMHCGDDLIFRTPGWDTKVKEMFDQYPDKIAFVYGNDGHPRPERAESFGTHGFLHKNWVEAVGYFVPPYFSSDFNDTWLNDVAEMIGRKQYVNIITEHMHPGFEKRPFDQTDKDRMERHVKDDVKALYESKSDERKADAEKLRKVMHG